MFKTIYRYKIVNTIVFETFAFSIHFWLRFGVANIINTYLRLKIRGDIFNLKYVLIEFVLPNLSQIYFCMLDIFKTHFSEFVYPCCEFTKSFCNKKNFCNMFFLFYKNFYFKIYFTVKLWCILTLELVPTERWRAAKTSQKNYYQPLLKWHRLL